MEFVLLIFINIIMGTIFYLILRLKLEKHASDYREKRLKREIDEIISVFNETAERNITILENRIDYLKKLLEKSGTIDNIDLKIDDLNNYNQDIKEIDKKEMDIKKSNPGTDTFNKKNLSSALEIPDNNTEVPENEIADNQEKNFGSISKYYLQIKEKLNNVYKSVVGYKPGMSGLYNKNGDTVDLHDDPGIYDRHPADVSSIPANSSGINDISSNDKTNFPTRSLNDEVISEISYSELEEMFRTSNDKYLLISELFNKGYPAELICKCSGIPIGEIKLVLDLNSSV
jgi:hypothetical protein